MMVSSLFFTSIPLLLMRFDGQLSRNYECWWRNVRNSRAKGHGITINNIHLMGKKKKYYKNNMAMVEHHGLDLGYLGLYHHANILH
jgi:hypothetical protein